MYISYGPFMVGFRPIGGSVWYFGSCVIYFVVDIDHRVHRLTHAYMYSVYVLCIPCLLYTSRCE